LGENSLTLWAELEDLRKKRAALEFQLHSIEEKEKTLEESTKILEEKLAIQELEEKIKAKSAVVEELEFKMRDMEKRLKEPQTEPETATITEEPDAKSETHGYFLRG